MGRGPVLENVFQQIFAQAPNPLSPIRISMGKSQCSVALLFRDSARERQQPQVNLKHDNANLIANLTAWVHMDKSESTQNRKV